MSEKIYLHLLFLCGILCQGIIATLSDKDTRVSSRFVVRKRRVINHLPHGRSSPRIQDVNYLVRIKEDHRIMCAGVILSNHAVITAAPCVRHDVSIYTVLSGVPSNNRYNSHNVISKKVYFGSPPHQNIDSIALIFVNPPFEYTRQTGNILLHAGPLSVGTRALVAGWGYLYPLQHGTETRPRLRAAILPIMNHRDCQNDYQGRFEITDKYICTYDAQQYCAQNDEGAPLVVNDKLVGIHVWKGQYPNQRNPDVYINLQRTDYSEWIRENILLM